MCSRNIFNNGCFCDEIFSCQYENKLVIITTTSPLLNNQINAQGLSYTYVIENTTRQHKIIKPLAYIRGSSGSNWLQPHYYLCLVKNENIFRMHFDARRRRLVWHPNSIRASTNQSQGQRYILLTSRAAVLPRLDAGSDGVKPTSCCVIENLQTSCSSLVHDV